MKILVVGAGIAGLTLAGLLRREQFEVEIVEKAESFQHAGYMLGLYPLGSRVLNGLGLYEKFAEVSRPMYTYDVCNGKGQLVHSYDLSELGEKFGHIGQIPRARLLELLRSVVPHVPLRMGVGLEALNQVGQTVEVTLSDGSQQTYDLVVGADGINSKTRELLFGEVKRVSTGWGCWVWWADSLAVPHDRVTEYWGAGQYIGVYPTRSTVGVIAAGPTETIGREVVKYGADLRGRFEQFQGDAVSNLSTLPEDLAELFYWKFDDLRCERWYDGRVALLGDAVCAFLPTAGVGASMAMESAAVLADELSRTNVKHLDQALLLYQKRRQKRAESAQDDSRVLARMMYVQSAPLAWGRDQLLKVFPFERLIKNISDIMAEPI